MASTYGNAIKLSIFGQSHSAAIGCAIDGLPAGIDIDLDALQDFMARRAPGSADTSTPRKEADAVEILAGITDGHTNGAPIAAVICNTNTRSGDYAELRRVPRPGHADFPARVKYANCHDVAGGGHFPDVSPPRCALRAASRNRRFRSSACISSPTSPPSVRRGNRYTYRDPLTFSPQQRTAILDHSLPCISEHAAREMREAILAARADADSIGGVIECAAYGMPAGIGDPMFDGIENRIARIAFGIPAVKGVDFGAGFAAAYLTGSENNDSYRIEHGEVRPQTNHAGGILGGITTGMPIVWQMAVKPTPSIGREQQSVDMDAGSDASLVVRGRHDPCIVPRAVPVAEAACALALLDALLEDGYPLGARVDMAQRALM